MRLAVVLDTCTMFPFGLRDLLFRCAQQQLFVPRWTRDILTELSRSLIDDAGFSLERVDRLFARMRLAFPDAVIAGYQPLVSQMTNHPKDRHVLAATVHAGAKLIVTSNLRDFPRDALAPYRVTAQSPDEFLCGLVAAQSDTMARIVQQQARDLINPPISTNDLLILLGRNVPNFAQVMPAHILANPLERAESGAG